MEYSTKQFAALVPCSADTIHRWRQFEDGISEPLLAPDHEDERGYPRYTEAQLPIARALLNQRKSTLKGKSSPDAVDTGENISVIPALMNDPNTNSAQKNNAATSGYQNPNTDLNSEQLNHNKNTTAANISQAVVADSGKFSGKQILENLPDEILAQPRFLPVNADKSPKLSGWNQTRNQKYFSKIYDSAYVGFDVTGHDRADDYIVFDFDHVRNPITGEFVNEDAERWFNYLLTLETYCELSLSEEGFHFVAKPTQGKFGKIINNAKGTLYFDKKNPKCKLEIFYKQAARCIIFTGNVYQCAPKTPIEQGEGVDEYLSQVLNEIKRRNPDIDKKALKARQAKTREKAFTKDVQTFIDKINAITPEALEEKGYLRHSEKGAPRPNGYICNWCNSGTHEHKTGGLTYYEDTKLFYCHARGCGGDIIHFLSHIYGIPDNGKEFFALLKKIAHDFSIPYDTQIFDNPRKKFLDQIAINANDSIEDIQAKIRGLCEWARDKNGNPTKIKPTVQNYKLIFNNDPNLKGLFGRDDFRQEIVFKRRAVWHSKNAPLKDSWDDTDDAELRLYLAEFYAEMPTLQRTLDYTTRVAGENSFHAIKQFFEALPKWDGTARMETIFCKFLGTDDNPYTRAVTKHFFLGAIARAFYPGCDFQSVPVLQGAQGIGKSRVLRMLGGKHGVNPKGENWHIALRDQLDDSHAVDAMRKGWIVEIEEFAAGSRADVNAMKGVLSADDITRRFAYDRRAKTVKSHWVFIATCNDDAPLRDQTGARRFLPIKCHNKESTIVEGMTPEYIQQVWAEAYLTFKELFPTVDSFDADKLRLPVDIQKQAAEKAAGITQDDGLTTEIKGFIDSPILPDYIWLSFSKEERRKFFADGGKFSSKIMYSDLIARRQKRGGTKEAIAADIAKIKDFLNEENQWVVVETVPRGKDNPPDLIYHIYGTERRKHICAAEIFNECFGADRRKNMNRISEVLSRLDGWTLGERLQKVDPAYFDQRKPYYRDF